MNNKSDFRIKAKELRKNLDIEQLSLLLCEKIRQWDFYQKSKNILIYYPLKYEVNLLSLLNDEKNFFLPKVVGEKLYICPYKENDKLLKSSLNIYEPCSLPILPSILDLIFVPALATDKENFRLGYGGGYYDRFLSMYSNITTVSAVSSNLIFEKLPHEPHDIKIDHIISI